MEIIIDGADPIMLRITKLNAQLVELEDTYTIEKVKSSAGIKTFELTCSLPSLFTAINYLFNLFYVTIVSSYLRGMDGGN